MPNANQVKAAFLVNFAKYTNWAESTLPNGVTEFHICVGLNTEIFATLQLVTGKQVKEKTLVVRSVNFAHEATNCQVLYWNENERALTADAISALLASGSLIVGEGRSTRGTIGFVEEENKIGFVVNLDAAHLANITMSAQLLKLAITTRGEAEGN